MPNITPHWPATTLPDRILPCRPSRHTGRLQPFQTGFSRADHHATLAGYNPSRPDSPVPTITPHWPATTLPDRILPCRPSRHTGRLQPFQTGFSRADHHATLAGYNPSRPDSPVPTITPHWPATTLPDRILPCRPSRHTDRLQPFQTGFSHAKHHATLTGYNPSRPDSPVPTITPHWPATTLPDRILPCQPSRHTGRLQPFQTGFSRANHHATLAGYNPSWPDTTLPGRLQPFLAGYNPSWPATTLPVRILMCQPSRHTGRLQPFQTGFSRANHHATLAGYNPSWPDTTLPGWIQPFLAGYNPSWPDTTLPGRIQPFLAGYNPSRPDSPVPTITPHWPDTTLPGRLQPFLAGYNPSRPDSPVPTITPH